jgi:hypothetical protein
MNASARPGDLGRLALANEGCLMKAPLQLPFRHILLEFMMANLTFVLPDHGFGENLSPEDWLRKHYLQRFLRDEN